MSEEMVRSPRRPSAAPATRRWRNLGSYLDPRPNIAALRSRYRTRKDKRTHLSLAARLWRAHDDAYIEGRTLDISRGGVFVLSQTPIREGTLVRFRLSRGRSEPIEGVGRVIWARHPHAADRGLPAGMGIRFIGMSDESLAALDRLATVERAVRRNRRKSDGGAAAALALVAAALTLVALSSGYRPWRRPQAQMARPAETLPKAVLTPLPATRELATDGDGGDRGEAPPATTTSMAPAAQTVRDGTPTDRRERKKALDERPDSSRMSAPARP